MPGTLPSCMYSCQRVGRVPAPSDTMALFGVPYGRGSVLACAYTRTDTAGHTDTRKLQTCNCKTTPYAAIYATYSNNMSARASM